MSDCTPLTKVVISGLFRIKMQIEKIWEVKLERWYNHNGMKTNAVHTSLCASSSCFCLLSAFSLTESKCLLRSSILDFSLEASGAFSLAIILLASSIRLSKLSCWAMMSFWIIWKLKKNITGFLNKYSNRNR